jgi:hypothetical protein
LERIPRRRHSFWIKSKYKGMTWNFTKGIVSEDSYFVIGRGETVFKAEKVNRIGKRSEWTVEYKDNGELKSAFYMEARTVSIKT